MDKRRSRLITTGRDDDTSKLQKAILDARELNEEVRHSINNDVLTDEDKSKIPGITGHYDGTGDFTRYSSQKDHALTRPEEIRVEKAIAAQKNPFLLPQRRDYYRFGLRLALSENIERDDSYSPGVDHDRQNPAIEKALRLGYQRGEEILGELGLLTRVRRFRHEYREAGRKGFARLKELQDEINRIKFQQQLDAIRRRAAPPPTAASEEREREIAALANELGYLDIPDGEESPQGRPAAQGLKGRGKQRRISDGGRRKG